MSSHEQPGPHGYIEPTLPFVFEDSGWPAAAEAHDHRDEAEGDAPSPETPPAEDSPTAPAAQPRRRGGLRDDLRRLFHPVWQRGPQGHKVRSGDVGAWSGHEYAWKCPTHGTRFTATPAALSRASNRRVWETYCDECAVDRTRFSTKHPNLVAYARGWHPYAPGTADLKGPLKWTCPRCTGEVAASVRTLAQNDNRVEKVCRRCKAPKLADVPSLTALFVSTADGQTDPAQVVYRSPKVSRDVHTTWRCDVCADVFELSINSAVVHAESDDRHLPLHRPCRTAARVDTADRAEKVAKRTRSRNTARIADLEAAFIEKAARLQAEIDAKEAEAAQKRREQKKARSKARKAAMVKSGRLPKGTE